MIFRKAVEIKDITDSGIIVAAFATLGVIDKDGDVTEPGFFGQQDAVFLPTHDWNHRPMGKGPIREVGDKALAEMKCNLEDPEAKNWHSWLKFDLKNGSPLQQYSYGFNILPGGSRLGEFGGKSVRFLQPASGGPGCQVHEVSPVVVGAGEMTGTLAVKSTGRKSMAECEGHIGAAMATCEGKMADHPAHEELMGHLKAAKDACSEAIGKGMRFSDEADAVLAAVDGFFGRASSLADLRGKEGRSLSAAATQRIKELADKLMTLSAGAGSAKDDAARIAARVEFGRALRAGHL